MEDEDIVNKETTNSTPKNSGKISCFRRFVIPPLEYMVIGASCAAANSIAAGYVNNEMNVLPVIPISAALATAIDYGIRRKFEDKKKLISGKYIARTLTGSAMGYAGWEYVRIFKNILGNFPFFW